MPSCFLVGLFQLTRPSLLRAPLNTTISLPTCKRPRPESTLNRELSVGVCRVMTSTKLSRIRQ